MILRRGLMLATLLLCGCESSGDGTILGYSTERPFPTSVSSVHIEMFQTSEFRRGLEFDLTEALVKRIEMDTPYMVATRRTADTVLSGEVLEVRQGTLGRNFRTDLPIETAATYIISFRWQDQRDGRILAERQQLPFTTTYIRPVGETFADSSMRGLEGLAERIVEIMETPW